MIKSKKEVILDARDGSKKGIVEIEVTGFATDKNGTTYNVVDYVVYEDGSKMVIKQKPYVLSNEQIDQYDVFVRDLAVFNGLSKTKRDWLKIKMMLFELTKQEPLYMSNAEDWELI